MSKKTLNSVIARIESEPKGVSMHVLLIDNKSAHLIRLKKLTRQKLGKTIFRLRDPREMTDEDVTWAELVLISGGTGRSIEKNPDTFRRMVDMLVKAGKPTLGICLGAEAIAVYFGSTLRDIGVRRVGNVRVHLESAVPAVLPEGGRSGMAYEFHRWAIDEVHEPLIGLAYSKDGVEIFRHSTLPIWGLQFHPEVRRKHNGGHILFAYALTCLRLNE